MLLYYYNNPEVKIFPKISNFFANSCFLTNRVYRNGKLLSKYTMYFLAPNNYTLEYAFRNSSLVMPDCVQIVRKVDALILGWLGIVKGVSVLSALIRSIEICSFSRTILNPKD